MQANTIEIMIGLLIAACFLAWVAGRLKLPYPILLTLGGLGIGFVPWESIVGWHAQITLRAELVFLIFLPPLLYHGGMMTTWRDFVANIRPIVLLAVGLVLLTTCVVAIVVHYYIPDFSWPVAFALGAIVSPPDAIAATAITSRLRIPKRIVSILEGESLINDATALVTFRFAVAAALTAVPFVAWEAGWRLLWVSIGGVAIGILAGVVVMWLRPYIRDRAIEGTLSLLSPFIAYMPAEWIGVSGVLAAVSAGIFVARRMPLAVSARSRLRIYAVWDAVVFLLNALIFILIGLQLPQILEDLREYSPWQLLSYATLVSAVVILVRILWIFPATYVPRWISKSFARRSPAPPWRHTTIIAWAGMRGIVSLAAAMSLPDGHEGTALFPHRDLIVFLTFSVILATLVIQGLSLPLVIMAFDFEEEDDETQEELTARHSIAVAALAKLAEMEEQKVAPVALLERIRRTYDDRVRYLVSRLMGEESPSGLPAYDTISQLQRQLLQVERRSLVLLRDQNVIGDEVMRKVEMDLDLEESKLHE
jgi:CPA1 family monovalent cation:H+ antiporter